MLAARRAARPRRADRPRWCGRREPRAAPGPHAWRAPTRATRRAPAANRRSRCRADWPASNASISSPVRALASNSVSLLIWRPAGSTASCGMSVWMTQASMSIRGSASASSRPGPSAGRAASAPRAWRNRRRPAGPRHPSRPPSKRQVDRAEGLALVRLGRADQHRPRTIALGRAHGPRGLQQLALHDAEFLGQRADPPPGTIIPFSGSSARSITAAAPGVGRGRDDGISTATAGTD